MTYINAEFGTKLTNYGKEAGKEAKAGKAVARDLHDACPNYESLEKPDQGSFRNEIAAYLIAALSSADQKLLASKPSDLASDSERVRRDNLGGTIRSQVSRLLKLAFPKDRGHAAKRTIEQYLIDTFKAIVQRCEKTDRGQWNDSVKQSYDHAKAALAAIK